MGEVNQAVEFNRGVDCYITVHPEADSLRQQQCGHCRGKETDHVQCFLIHWGNRTGCLTNSYTPRGGWQAYHKASVPPGERAYE